MARKKSRRVDPHAAEGETKVIPESPEGQMTSAEEVEIADQAQAASEGDTRSAKDVDQVPEWGEATSEQIGAADGGTSLIMNLSTEPKVKALQLLEALKDTINEQDEAVKERNEMKENWLRERAQFINYRDHMEQNKQQEKERASERLMRELLPVLDALDQALADEISPSAEMSMREGVERIHHLLLDILKKEGLTPVEATPGTPFDPAVHMAMLRTESMDEEADDSYEVVKAKVQGGYQYQSGKVLRPAGVKVGFASPAKEEAIAESFSEEAAQPDTTDVEGVPGASSDDSASGEAVNGGGPEEGETPVDKD